ncbi:hypothetical protein ACQ4LK_26030, partial [Bacillus pumilus]
RGSRGLGMCIRDRPEPTETISHSHGDDKPVTETQEQIVTAFKDVLGVKQVGIHAVSYTHLRSRSIFLNINYQRTYF